jgi:hypothetical protein
MLVGLIESAQNSPFQITVNLLLLAFVPLRFWSPDSFLACATRFRPQIWRSTRKQSNNGYHKTVCVCRHSKFQRHPRHLSTIIDNLCYLWCNRTVKVGGDQGNWEISTVVELESSRLLTTQCFIFSMLTKVQFLQKSPPASFSTEEACSILPNPVTDYPGRYLIWIQ